MYYYIIEPSRGKFIKRNEKIKDILGSLGIAGETVSPNSARTIEELTHIGIAKGYSTIVAVGSESLVNKVITVLTTEHIAKDTVLGIIPNDFNSELASIIGAKDLESACNILKLRKLEALNLCLIEPNKYFATTASIESNRNKEVYFSIENLQGKALAKKVTVKPGLNVTFFDESLHGKTPEKFTRWLFGKDQRDIYTTNFETKRIRFEGDKENLPVFVSGEIVAKTPVTFSNHPRLLKIIVTRDRIQSEEKK